jgi:hypothetical protein
MRVKSFPRKYLCNRAVENISSLIVLSPIDFSTAGGFDG